MREFEKKIRNEYRTADPDIRISFVPESESTYEVFTDSLKGRLMFVLMEMPNGIQTMSADLPELPESNDDHYCIYYGRRDGSLYTHSHEEIWAKYGHRMAMCERIPDVLAPDMGNQMYMLHAMDDEELEQMISFIGEKH